MLPELRRESKVGFEEVLKRHSQGDVIEAVKEFREIVRREKGQDFAPEADDFPLEAREIFDKQKETNRTELFKWVWQIFECLEVQDTT